MSLLRNSLFPPSKEVEQHLRHRRDSSRLEAFSDGVFGLAVTLLVASQQVPSTFTGLMQLGQQIIPAALSFGILFGLWYAHCKFFRRYPLEDDITLRLNGLFLFVLLVGIYPMKFMISWVGQVFTGTAGAVKLANGSVDYAAVRHDQILPLMTLYVGFFASTSLCLGLMHLHAYRQRRTLGLNPVEATDAFSNGVNQTVVSTFFLATLPLVNFFFGTRTGILSWLAVMAGIGFLVRRWVNHARAQAIQQMKGVSAAESLPTPQGD